MVKYVLLILEAVYAILERRTGVRYIEGCQDCQLPVGWLVGYLGLG